MRDIHLYLGLFLSPLILIFAVSTLLLTHQWRPAPDATSQNTAREAIPVDVPDGTGSLPQAKEILRQLQITGEIEYVRHSASQQRLVIPVLKPGSLTRVEVDLRRKTATVQRQNMGLGTALIYLHKMPGQHLRQYRGNWWPMWCWMFLTDGVVYGILLITLTGLYLSWMLKAERGTGMILLAAGLLTTIILVAILCLPTVVAAP
jgi:hypothetical protein